MFLCPWSLRVHPEIPQAFGVTSHNFEVVVLMLADKSLADVRIALKVSQHDWQRAFQLGGDSPKFDVFVIFLKINTVIRTRYRLCDSQLHTQLIQFSNLFCLSLSVGIPSRLMSYFHFSVFIDFAWVVYCLKHFDTKD